MAQSEKPPEINYLAKDYAGFRQLLLDHLSLWLPGWSEDHPADVGHALVDVLAYAADYLSYYQDAMAAEAYLGTARLRRSVKRHVRLLDYAWHEGCNARVWVQVLVKAKEVSLPKGTQLFTRLDGEGVKSVIPPDSQDYDAALARAPVIFETMMNCHLYEDHNQMHFSIPPAHQAAPEEGATSTQLRDQHIYLKKDATSAELDLPEGGQELQVGQVLVFEEKGDPKAGYQANPGHRHAVRLTGSSRLSDHKVKIAWGTDDALPFDLCLSASNDGIHMLETSIALGNIVLADCGRTIKTEELPALPRSGQYYPHLRHRNITFSEFLHYEALAMWPAKEMLSQEPHRALPMIKLYELGTKLYGPDAAGGDRRALLPLIHFQGSAYPAKQWIVRSELMSSGKYERDYTVDIEDDGRAYLRFGFYTSGWRPEDIGAPFLATYRIGNGSSGNIARNAIAHIVTADQGIVGARNPLPAQGGTDPVRTEEARRHAPQAYRSIKPCVTPSDYAEAAQRHPQVVDAAAQFHQTGGRPTIFITVQRRYDQPVDANFQRELAGFLEPFRVAGVGLEICAPRVVPLEINLDFYTQTGCQTSRVNTALRQAFTSNEASGFFHPDRWKLGQTVYKSQVIARAMAVPGIDRAAVNTFHRRCVDHNEDPIYVEPLEIIRVHIDDRDPTLDDIIFTPR